MLPKTAVRTVPGDASSGANWRAMSVSLSVTRDRAFIAWGMNAFADGRKDVFCKFKGRRVTILVNTILVNSRNDAENEEVLIRSISNIYSPVHSIHLRRQTLPILRRYCGPKSGERVLPIAATVEPAIPG